VANDRDEQGWEAEMRGVFGRLDKLPGSRNDLFFLARQAAEAPVRPKIYLCCGTEDDLYQDNLRFRDLLKKLPLELTYKEGRGGHDWIYWDAMIQKVLAWLPLE
jgi:S-formylglutathione hydrolase FrmB